MKTVVFAKYSNDRADEFAICTEILKNENGEKSIRKRPVEKRESIMCRAFMKTI